MSKINVCFRFAYIQEKVQKSIQVWISLIISETNQVEQNEKIDFFILQWKKGGEFSS